MDGPAPDGEHVNRLLILGFFVVIGAFSVACGGGDGGGSTPTAPTVPSANVPFSTTDLQVGTGREAANGGRLIVNYTGWLYSSSAPDNKGAQFDTSIGRGPYPFVLGAGQVIRGWDQGIVGMRIGGVRRLVIPPELAYGAQGSGPIPGNATILFEVSLLDIQ
jgi:FKBP-type peptidyl-prolyl cis-trans isomerase FkpA